MPLLHKKWKLRTATDRETVKKLMQEIGIGETLATLMAQRGISSYADAKQYFTPNINQLHDPFLMKGMDLAVERIEKAIQNNEGILIYGDYDVDGTTSVSLVYSYLNKFHNNIQYYIPNRQGEGYGISFKGIDFAKDQNLSLIIALDCGIKAVEQIDYANKKGIDFIICDHHTPGDIIPQALAILNPKQKDCNYPYKELCGCGIGFKLSTALHQKVFPDSDPYQFLDLVTIAIGADIVPLTGENRVLAYLGLQKVNDEPGKGIASLINVCGYKGDFSISDIVFKLAPRINAAGRISHANEAVAMLNGANEELLGEIAQQVNQHNEDRKNIDKEITAECLDQLSSTQNIETQFSTVVFNETWHKGVIGIVASRLIENYYRPTIVLTQASEDTAVGSARSIEGFSIYNAIEACSDLLIQFGGHSMAAGMTILKENIPAFIDKFEEVVKNTIPKELLTPVEYFDFELPIERIGWSLQKSMSRLGPFGPQNMQPTFISKHISPQSIRVLGNAHLKFSVFNGIQNIDCIAFGKADMLEDIQNADGIDICYTIDKNVWQGNETLQLFIKDIKISDI